MTMSIARNGARLLTTTALVPAMTAFAAASLVILPGAVKAQIVTLGGDGGGNGGIGGETILGPGGSGSPGGDGIAPGSGGGGGGAGSAGGRGAGAGGGAGGAGATADTIAGDGGAATSEGSGGGGGGGGRLSIFSINGTSTLGNLTLPRSGNGGAGLGSGSGGGGGVGESIGFVLAPGSTLQTLTDTFIFAGDGGAGGAGGATGNGGNGGDGGATFVSGSGVFLAPRGLIGGRGGNGGAGVVAGRGGTGGAGLVQTGGMLQNAGTILGGFGGVGSVGGNGGIGLIGAGVVVINENSILGGRAGGGLGGTTSFGGSGGIGVLGSDMAMTNLGLIFGGDGTAGTAGGGRGGDALVGTGLTIDNRGTIRGGFGVDGVQALALNLSGTNTITNIGTLTGGVEFASGTTTFDLATDQALANVVSGAGGLIKAGTGTLTLGGTNIYSGVTTVSQGTLTVTNSAALGAVSQGTLVAGGATLALQGGITTNEPITINGFGVANGGAIRNLTNSNTLAGAITLGSAARINSDVGFLTISGSVSGAGHDLRVGGPSSFILSGPMSLGGGRLIMDGQFAATISGANIDVGELVIERGVVQLGFLTSEPNGSVADTVPVTILNNGGLTVNASETIGSLAGGVSTRVLGFGNSTLTVGANNASTLFAGRILQDLSLNKIGTGTLTLTGDNAFTGGLNISGGTLAVTQAAALGIGGVLVNGLRQTLRFEADMTVANMINGVGVGYQIDTGANTVILNGSLSGGGANKFGTGTLVLNNAINDQPLGLALFNGTLIVNGGVQGNVGGSSSSVIGGTGTITGFLSSSGTLSPGVAPGQVGTLTVGSLSPVLTSNFLFDLGALGGVHDLIVSEGALVLDGRLNVNALSGWNIGTGSYTLMTYDGALTDNGLELGASLTDGLPAGVSYAIDTSIAGQVNLVRSYAGAYFWDGGNFAPNGSVNGGAGTWSLAATNFANVDGLFNLAWSNQTGPSGTVGNFAGTAGTITLADDLSFGTLNFLTGGYVLTGGSLNMDGGTISVTTGEARIESLLSGAGGLTKLGTGTLTLTGSNTYTGLTSVTGGTLAVNGSLAGAVSVLDGGTLGGTGTIGGAVTVGSGGTLAAGQSPGTLRLEDNLTLNAGSISLFELGEAGVAGGPNNDLVQVTGTLALNGGTIQVVRGSGFTSGQYTLFTYGTLSGALGNMTLDPLSGGFVGNLALGAGAVLLNTASSGDLVWWNGITTSPTGAIVGGDGIWSPGGANFTEADGLVSGPWAGNGSLAVFGGTAGTVTIAPGEVLAPSGLNFVSDGYVITGGDAAAGLLLSGPTGIDTATGVGATIAAVIAGSGSLTKTGNGTLTLTGANTYSGATTVLGGTLVNNGTVAGDVTSAAGFVNAGRVAGALGVLAGGTAENLTGAVLSGGATIAAGGTLDNAGAIGGDVSNAGMLTNMGSIAGLLVNSGTLTNGGSLAGDISNTGSFTSSGAITGTLTNAVGGTVNLSGTTGAVSNAGMLSNAGMITGPVENSGTLTNASSITGQVTNAGALTNSGSIAGLVETAGMLTSTGTLGGGLTALAASTANIQGTLAGAVSNAGRLTLTGATSGIGAVSQEASGVFDLAGNSTAIGSLAGSGSVLLGAATLTSGSNNASTSFAGVISGSGGLTKTGSGTLTLTGANTYSGTTTISGGALQLGAGGTSGTLGSGAIINNAMLVLNRSDALSLGNAISGSGMLVQDGTGTTTLTGANTYSGGTLVSRGRLVGNTTALQGAILNNAVLAFAQGADGTFAGMLGGTGRVEKTGAGTLTFAGDGRALTGPFAVLGGTLRLDGRLDQSVVTLAAGTTLAGNGLIGGLVAESGAQVSAGNSIGAIGVTGNVTFSAGSRLLAEVSEGGADLISAGGTARLAGALDVVNIGAAAYRFNTGFDLVTAAGGITGSFDSVSFAGFDPIYRPVLRTTATGLTLVLAPNSLAGLAGNGLSGNQAAVAARIDAAVAAGFDPQAFVDIYNLAPAQLGAALDQLSGEVHAAVGRAAMRQSRLPREAVLERAAGAALASNPQGTRWGSWGKLMRSWGDVASGDGTAAQQSDTEGFVIGFDGGTANDTRALRVGAYGSYLDTRIAIDARGSSGRIEQAGGGLYASLALGGLSLVAGGGAARFDITTGRTITLPGLADITASASRGDMAQVFGRLGYRFDLGAASLEPFVAGDHAWIALDQTTERGGAAALAAGRQEYKVAGATAGIAVKLPLGPLRLDADAAARFELGDRAPQALLALAAAPGQATRTAATRLAGTAFTGRLGAVLPLTSRIEVRLDYAGEFSTTDTEHTAQAGISIRF